MKVGSYIPAFIAAGIPPIVGSLLMVAIRFYFKFCLWCFLHKLSGSYLLLWKMWTKPGKRKVPTQRMSWWRTAGGRRRGGGGARRRWRRRRRCSGGRGAVRLDDRRHNATCNAIVKSSKCVNPFQMASTHTLKDEYILIVKQVGIYNFTTAK